MTMSEKDKKTLIIAAVALLIFGIALLGIKPAFTNLKEAKAINTELSAKKQEMQSEISALPTYKTQLDNAISDYNSTAARVYGDLTNDKIHDEVVDFVTKCGVDITSLTIGDVSPQTVAAYTITDGVGMGGTQSGSIKLANVSVTVSGSTANIISLVDKINKTEGTYLQQTSFTDSADIASVSVSYVMVLADSYNK